MKNATYGRKNWRSNTRLSFDATCMPELREVLKTTKTEISRKVFNSQNSDLAEKVLKGKDTDLGKIIGICNYFGIDLGQFIVDDKGRHPQLVFDVPKTETVEAVEVEAVDDETTGRQNKPERFPLSAEQTEPTAEPASEGLLNQGNAAQLIAALTEATRHERTLYEQIAALKAEVAMLRERATHYDLQRSYAMPMGKMVQDGSSISEK